MHFITYTFAFLNSQYDLLDNFIFVQYYYFEHALGTSYLCTFSQKQGIQYQI